MKSQGFTDDAIEAMLEASSAPGEFVSLVGLVSHVGTHTHYFIGWFGIACRDTHTLTNYVALQSLQATYLRLVPTIKNLFRLILNLVSTAPCSPSWRHAHK